MHKKKEKALLPCTVKVKEEYFHSFNSIQIPSESEYIHRTQETDEGPFFTSLRNLSESAIPPTPLQIFMIFLLLL